MTPVELLDDHARRPRNIGKLLNASAVGDIGSIVVGDALRFYISVSEDGGQQRISAAKFQVFNCPEQLGPSSVITEMVIGRTLDDAEELGYDDIRAHIGGIEVTELPPRLWAIDGLRAAIATWRGEDLDTDHDLDPLLCRCLGISEETVRQSIGVLAINTVDGIVQATGAGSVCGSCRVDMPRLIDEATGAAKPAAASTGATPVTRIQLMLRIQRVVDERFLPDIRAAGGDVELWDFRDGRVYVRAKGTLTSNETVRREALGKLEALLKTEIDPTLGVAE